MKLGHKGNQVSLIIMREFPGHMIKVKGHLGSMNFGHVWGISIEILTKGKFLKCHHNFIRIWT